MEQTPEPRAAEILARRHEARLQMAFRFLCRSGKSVSAAYAQPKKLKPTI